MSLTYIFTSEQRQIFSDCEHLPITVNRQWHKILNIPFYATMANRISAMTKWLEQEAIYHFEIDNYVVISRNESKFYGLVCGVLSLLGLGIQRLTEVDEFREKYRTKKASDRN
ncbi:hypothetical protein [Crocosphaera sp. Alani8]|uniref:hypothetical protein n=1 Tax=Crocosphaera sp. Alani8 TaxID=3038952 RepID=UPI00313CBE96